MRVFPRLFASLLLCALACSARATRINILDPTGSPINTITATPFPVDFSAAACDVLLPGASPSQMGCYGFLNRTSSAWVGLELTLQTADPIFNFTCNSQPPADPAFGSATCVYNKTASEYELTFTDGTIPNNTRQYFVITEDDLPADTLHFTATPILASTPEPPALTLLGTGALCAAGLLWSRRRVNA